MKVYIIQQTEFNADGTIKEVELLEAYRNRAEACKCVDEYASEIPDDERIGDTYKSDYTYEVEIEAEKALPGCMFEGSGEYVTRFKLEVVEMNVI